MTVRDAISGFYAVLDRDDEELARLLVAHARVLQVRIKPRARTVDTAELVRIARMARRICDAAGAALVVNDRIDVALAVGANGVHLGQTDLAVADARAVLDAVRRDLWIGVSTHDLHQVRAAIAAGAGYLGFGPVFATSTKVNPDAVQGLDGLRAAVQAAGALPIVAIGGITPAHARAVYATGAAAICAISAVNDAEDRAGSAAHLTIANDSKLYQTSQRVPGE